MIQIIFGHLSSQNTFKEIFQHSERNFFVIIGKAQIYNRFTSVCLKVIFFQVGTYQK